VARTRQIKPEFWTDDDIVTLEPCAKLLFIGMWGLADREGRLEDKPLSILMRILPRDQVDPDLLLGELAARNLIVRYVADGTRVIAIRSFKKHQHVHPEEAKSRLPPPPASDAEKANDSDGPVDRGGSNEIQLNLSESLPASDFRLPASDLRLVGGAKRSEPFPPAGPPVLVFPASGKPDSWALTEEWLSEARIAFPAFDVLADLRVALAKVKTGATRKPTARGMSRFLMGWLGRTNDRGNYQTNKQVPASAQYSKIAALPPGSMRQRP
jgi:hypothetical protein